MTFENGAVHLMFPPDAVSTSIVVHRWKYRSPPLQEHEAITSNVIELSPMESQGLTFNTKVKLSLSHSATELRGYELVIKKLVDKEMNDWKKVAGTRDVRCREGMNVPLYSRISYTRADYRLSFCLETFSRVASTPLLCF